MNKTVAIVVCAWPPQGGGIGNNAYYQAKELKRLGYEVKVFTPDFSGRPLTSALDFKPEFLPVFLSWGKAGIMFSLLNKLKNFEIVHLYYPFFGSDLIVYWFKKIHPEKKIVLHYQMDPVGRGSKKIIFKFYLKTFLGPLIKAADKVGVLSFDHARHSYLAPYLQNWPEKFVEIPNGVDTEIFKPAAKNSKLLASNNFSVQDKIIVFVGGLDKQHYFKGIEILLSALKLVKEKVPNSKLLIIGDGNLRQQYEKQAEVLALKSDVRFIGWVKNEDLPAYYNLAEIFVLPSTASTESFGIVTAEAQACGLPAVVSDWPGARQTLKDGETGYLVRPGDKNDLAEKLTQLLLDSDLAKKFGQAGRIRSERNYSWQTVIERIDSLYQKL